MSLLVIVNDTFLLKKTCRYPGIVTHLLWKCKNGALIVNKNYFASTNRQFLTVSRTFIHKLEYKKGWGNSSNIVKDNLRACGITHSRDHVMASL